MADIIFKVAEVLSDDTLVLNAGQNKDIKLGYRFLVYSMGNEVKDPDTGENLGKLEIVKETGVVTHLQQNMCTLKSDITYNLRPLKTKIKSSGLLGGNERIMTEERNPIPIPFDNPNIGDFAKYIS